MQIVIRCEDGSEMGAYVARPRGEGPHPAMMVFQEALGVNSQLRGVADRSGHTGRHLAGGQSSADLNGNSTGRIQRIDLCLVLAARHELVVLTGKRTVLHIKVTED